MKKKKIIIIFTILLIIALIILGIKFYLDGKKTPQNFGIEKIETEKENQENQNTVNENIVEEMENELDNKINESNSNIVGESNNKENLISPSLLEKDEQSNKQTHTHEWKDYTAERWIPNIVTVVDEPEKTISGAQLYTLHPDGNWYSDGEIYWFEDGFTIENLKEIIIDKMKNENYIGNYVNRTKTIPAVTHEEDQGHMETYVAYQYCDCGARKEAE